MISAPVLEAATAAQTVAIQAGQAASTGTQVAAEEQIAAVDATQKQLEYAGHLSEWLKGQSQWVQKFAFKNREWIMKVQQFAAKMAVRKSQFMQKMAIAAIRFQKFMAMIARFMPIIKVMMIIIIIFTKFLQYVIMLIAALFISLLLVVHKILSVPGIIYIPTAIYWFIIDFIPFLLYFILYMVILLFITVICAILSALSFLPFVKKMIHCENSPMSWYKTVNWHMGNKFKRGGIFCSRPCRKGYAPDVQGSFCVKNDKLASDHCPHAQVMRIYSGTDRSSKKYAYVDFNDKTNIKYRTKMPNDREGMIKDYFLKRKKFSEKCDDSMNGYNDVTMNICSNLDVIEKYGLYGLKADGIKKLQKVCSNAFCTPRNSYPFCTALANTSKADDEILIKLLAKLGIGIIVFLVVFISLIRIIKEM